MAVYDKKTVETIIRSKWPKDKIGYGEIDFDPGYADLHELRAIAKELTTEDDTLKIEIHTTVNSRSIHIRIRRDI